MISLPDEQQQQPRGTMLPMRREQAGCVTFCRYVKARRRRWINSNASGRLFKRFLLIPRFSFTVLLVSEGRPPLARLYWTVQGSSATEAIKSIEKASYQDWETPERKRRNDMMPNQFREKPGRLVLVAGVLREFRRLYRISLIGSQKLPLPLPIIHHVLRIIGF